ncbi:ribosome small subunit-dependent GTPase A [Ligilactobacillus ruminis]|uniref:Small ribosomal subunit biogenesis GTPase RsgA n=1 Tax=Ligilactobacillus ruminis TaxID=1623 RepID=A0A6A8GXT6_9LACO|nr:ribosome small subunit-dependent GTPase A [Ligilactobacillus ruminis]MSA19836.1 ribosome small subunit-dependent GTPase A [Ligilactobacillus ruminis]MSA21820.1 ribosome small subunit-dependent GTPase A [Ligilactobacillus ruminis]MSA23785.1 ribosome small subunit-dependent GTPase A [Ligilactobacillus ruminis]MSA34028.1 ribosome small subunit-dependent GTPase A [Ligilactobacillus ruminis]MSA40452.1 ribosome small subunit-dependent GTPase A [Ligilactobacillus ruminis]
MAKGQIRQSLSGYYDIFSEGKTYRTRARGNFRKKGQTPLVGDYVEFKADNENEGYVLKILERKNQLVRPPVANVDCAIVVTACVEPDFSSNLLDRQLVMLSENEIVPILYFSKADLMDETTKERMLPVFDYYSKYYRTVVSEKNMADEELVSALLEEAGNVLVVMGQTGAGKSTLLNRLDPKLKLETGEISKALSRGRHTTRKVSLMDVKGHLVADTPGFSSFELREIEKERLSSLFEDFNEYSPQCRFRGCLHLNEPDCAVKAAVLEGKILESRYENYKLFQKMIQEQKPRYKR